jgi:hypothetical protein
MNSSNPLRHEAYANIQRYTKLCNFPVGAQSTKLKILRSMLGSWTDYAGNGWGNESRHAYLEVLF